MLKLGQDVIIYDTPTYGDEYFDEDYIYERAIICGHTGVCRAEEFTEDELRPVGTYTLF